MTWMVFRLIGSKKSVALNLTRATAIEPAEQGSIIHFSRESDDSWHVAETFEQIAGRQEWRNWR